MKLAVIFKQSTSCENIDGRQVNANGVSEGSLGLEQPQELRKM